MKKKIIKLLEKLFSICGIISIIGGVGVAVLFIISIIVGGTNGENLAVFTKNSFLPIFIRIATLAILSGLVASYVGDSHGLLLREE